MQLPSIPAGTQAFDIISRLEALVLAGGEVSVDDAVALAGLPDDDVPALAAAGDRLRKHFCGDRVELCAIVSARTGACSEDCAFCAQAGHSKAHSEFTPMMSPVDILAAAKSAERFGVHRFSIVTSGKALSDRDFEKAIEALRIIGDETGVSRCASLGLLTAERAIRLAEAGVSRYHHNLETCESYFGEVCTTHTYQERVATVRAAREAGMQVCCGGILNVGENWYQRITLAFELSELAPDSVPVNFLDPRPGTPMEGRALLSATEAVRILAVYRFIMPKTSIRLAGGCRETFSRVPSAPLRSGANAMIVGDLLTTSGPDAASVAAMVRSIGLDPSIAS
jgi:biotin synthase